MIPLQRKLHLEAVKNNRKLKQEKIGENLDRVVKDLQTNKLNQRKRKEK